MKRGVTRPILIIGMIVITVVVLSSGILLFSGMFKDTPDFLAFEGKLTAGALVAAPEHAEIKTFSVKSYSNEEEKRLGIGYIGYVPYDISDTNKLRLSFCSGETQALTLQGFITNPQKLFEASLGVVGLALEAGFRLDGDTVYLETINAKIRLKCFPLIADLYLDWPGRVLFLKDSNLVRGYDRETGRTYLDGE